jgi:hypothetical protein
MYEGIGLEKWLWRRSPLPRDVAGSVSPDRRLKISLVGTSYERLRCARRSETKQFVVAGVTLAFQARIKGVTEGDMPIHNGTETVASSGTEAIIDGSTEIPGNDGMEMVIDRRCLPRQHAKMPENNQTCCEREIITDP